MDRPSSRLGEAWRRRARATPLCKRNASRYDMARRTGVSSCERAVPMQPLRLCQRPRLHASQPPSRCSRPRPFAPSSSDAERRRLTVLFCDLVDPIALSGQRDPEDPCEVVGADEDAAQRAVRAGGSHWATPYAPNAGAACAAGRSPGGPYRTGGGGRRRGRDPAGAVGTG